MLNHSIIIKRFTYFLMVCSFLCCTPVNAQSAINLLFVGNSITYGDQLSDPLTQAPPAICRAIVEDATGLTTNMYNGGHCGITTWGFLPGREDFTRLLDKAKDFQDQYGGIHGLNVKIWEVEQISSHRITFHYFSPDGEESFPANLHIWVTYSISPHTLDISFRAHADRATVVSLTNHAYFNLSGEGEGTIADHRLQIFANEYTPFDATACPTGEIASITGTLLDFRQPTRLGDRMFHPEFAKWRGINENFILSSPDFLKKAAVLSASGRSLTILTTMPGLQLYTGGYIESCVGKSGRRYAPHHAICLEPQYFPDSPNHAHFPSTRITPNRDFNESIRLVFSY